MARKKAKNITNDYVINDYRSRFPVLKEEEEKRLLIEYKINNNTNAREILFNSNIGLVLDIYQKKFVTHYKYRDDLIQEGLIGLSKCLEKFDLKRECRLSTYATKYITGYMKRFLEQKTSLIKVSTAKTGKVFKLKKARSNLLKELEYEPSIEELSIETNIPINEVIELYPYIDLPISLNAEISTSKRKDQLIQMLKEDESCIPENIIIKQEQNKELYKILDKLPDFERHLVSIKFGFYDGYPHTLKETRDILYKLNIINHLCTVENLRQHYDKICNALNCNKIRNKLGYENLKQEPDTNNLRKKLIK